MNNKKIIKEIEILINEGKEILRTQFQELNIFGSGLVLSVDKDKYTKWYSKLDIFIMDNDKYRDILKYVDYSLSTANELKGTLTRLEALKESLESDSTNNDYNLIGNITVEIKPEIYNHIKQYLDVEDYFHAVEESYKIVREKLREITGDEKATNAFKEENFEKIFGHKPTSEVEKDFFDGVKFLHMSIQMFRNEKAHKLAKNLDKNRAYHYIALASLAYDFIVSD